jgi:hypothetical protein
MFCGYFKKRGFCFVSLIGVYNFAAQKAKRKRKYMRLQGLIILSIIIIPDCRCEKA